MKINKEQDIKFYFDLINIITSTEITNSEDFFKTNKNI